MSTRTETQDPIADDSQALLQLFIQQPEQGSVDATVPVRWCTSPALAQMLEDKGAINPFLYITIRPYTQGTFDDADVRIYKSDSARYLVPLTQEMQYVSFSRPGHNEVAATIVWNQEGKGVHTLQAIFARRKDDDWTKSFQAYSESTFMSEMNVTYKTRSRQYSGCILGEASDTISVDVPSDMFAKEPPQWVKDYTGKFSDTKAFDQCRMRRRVLISMIFLPLFFLIGYTFRTALMVVGSFWGLRKMRFGNFVHPFRERAEDVMADIHRSDWREPFWFIKADGSIRSPIRWPINPISIVLLATGLWVIGSIQTGTDENMERLLGWSWLQALSVSVAIHLLLIALIAVGCVLVLIFGALMGVVPAENISARLTTRRQRRELAKAKQQELDQKEQLAELSRQLRGMTCTMESSKVSVDALPANKRSVRLRLQMTKQKVCKPYAR